MVLCGQSLGLGADVQPELDDLKLFEQDAEDDEDGSPGAWLDVGLWRRAVRRALGSRALKVQGGQV